MYTGGDAARGGSTAIHAAGGGQAAAREIAHAAALDENGPRAGRYADAYSGSRGRRIVEKVELAGGIVEFTVYAPPRWRGPPGRASSSGSSAGPRAS